MRRSILILPVVLLCLGATCPPKPPEPTPTPTPTPGPQYTDMLLRTCGSGQFCMAGKPVDFAGCIPCCMNFEEGNAGWPMFSRDFVDFCQRQGRATFFHARPGPFLVADEPDLANVGGPYLEVDGKADLTRWNDKFWEWFGKNLEYAGERGSWVEVDLIDSWRLKEGCQYSAWNAGRNLQSEDHCSTSHRGQGDAVHDAWLRKLVEVTGPFGNVIYQIGNESASVAGRNAGLFAWEKWVFDRVRVHEQDVGLRLVHQIGTNSEFDEIESSFPDYVNSHGSVPKEPAYGKPTTNNEINPAPNPTGYISMWCRAKKGGAYFWAWRAEQPKADWDSVLAGISKARLDDCSGVSLEDCPFPVKPTTSIHVKPFGTHGTCDGRPCPAFDGTPHTGSGPVWPEDSSFRADCELKSTGGLPTITVDEPLRIDHMIHGGWGFTVGGHGTSPVHCTIPNPGPGWRGCVDGAGAPLVVSVP